MTCRCLIIAGGTGGHIFPALAVAEALEKQGCQIHWLGSRHGLETRLVPDKYHLQTLSIKGLRRAGLLAKLCLPWRLLHSVYQAWRIIYRVKPDAVLAMGGYVAAAGGLAARLACKKLIIHEQNAKAGLSNRCLARFASVRLQAFDGALPDAITVGNPLRPALFAINKKPPAQPLNFLILGGSQGARPLNQAVQELLCDGLLNHDLSIWHQSGEADYLSLKQAYDQSGVSVRLDAFIKDMAAAYGWADVILCRAGAMTVSEIAAVGVASILVPYPFAADNHQYANALFLSQQNAAILLPQSELTAQRLHDLIQRFIRDRAALSAMANSAKKLAVDNSTQRVAGQLLSSMKK